MKPTLTLLCGVLLGCAAEVPIHEPEPRLQAVEAAALVTISARGPEPARLHLGSKQEVVFLNASGQWLTTVRVSPAAGPGVEGRRGFEGLRGQFVSALLVPGQAAVLAISPGAEVDYRVSGVGSDEWVGRITRSGP